MSKTIEGARKLIADRLREIDAEAAELERALKGMVGTSRQRSRRKAADKKRGRRKSRRLAPRGQRREQLLAAVKAKPGARPAELASAIGISQSQVHGLIRKARAEKLIVKKDGGYTLKK